MDLIPQIKIRPTVYNNTIELNWNYPVNFSNINGYYVECSSIGFKQFLDKTSKNFKKTDLINGNKYSFSIKSIINGGYSRPSIFRTVVIGNKPSVPSNIQIVNEINANLTISWETNNTNNNKAIYNIVTVYPLDSNYNLNQIPQANIKISSNIIQKSVRGDILSKTFTLNKNTIYKALVQSTNDAGWSNYDNLSNQINPDLPLNGLQLWLDPKDLNYLTFANSEPEIIPPDDILIPIDDEPFAPFFVPVDEPNTYIPKINDNLKVTQWNDKSINNNHAYTSSALPSPTYDMTKKQLIFYTNNYLILPNNSIPSGNSNYSIFMNILINSKYLNSDTSWFLYSDDNNKSNILGAYYSNSNIYNSLGNNNLGNLIDINTNYLFEMTYNNLSGTRNIYINNNIVNSDNLSNKSSGNYNNIIGNLINPPSSNSVKNSNSTISIGEILIYNRLLSNIERLSVESYMNFNKLNGIELISNGNSNINLIQGHFYTYENSANFGININPLTNQTNQINWLQNLDNLSLNSSNNNIFVNLVNNDNKLEYENLALESINKYDNYWNLNFYLGNISYIPGLGNNIILNLGKI